MVEMERIKRMPCIQDILCKQERQGKDILLMKQLQQKVERLSKEKEEADRENERLEKKNKVLTRMLGNQQNHGKESSKVIGISKCDLFLLNRSAGHHVKMADAK